MELLHVSPEVSRKSLYVEVVEHWKIAAVQQDVQRKISKHFKDFTIDARVSNENQLRRRWRGGHSHSKKHTSSPAERQRYWLWRHGVTLHK